MYIVLELFDFNYPTIVTDEHGMPKIYEHVLDAEREARECQQGMVVPLETHLINLLKDIRGFLFYIKNQHGDEFDEDNLEQRINNLLI